MENDPHTSPVSDEGEPTAEHLAPSSQQQLPDDWAADGVLEALFGSHPQPALIVEPESGRVVAANRAARRAFGYAADELAGCHAATLSGSDSHWATVVADAQSQRFTRRDGSAFVADTRVTGIHHHGLPAVLVRLITHSNPADGPETPVWITSASRAECLLSASNEALRDLLHAGLTADSLQRAVNTLGPATGADRLEVIAFGTAGGTPQEATCAVWERPGTTPASDRAHRDAPVRIDGQPWGAVRWFAPAGHPSCGDADAAALELLAEAMGAALSHSRATSTASDYARRFRSVVDNVPGVVFQCVIRDDGSIYFPYVSPAGEHVFGIDLTVLQDRPTRIHEIIHPNDASSFWEAIADARQERSGWEWNGRLVAPDGSARWASGVARLSVRADGVVQWDGLILDVTSREETLQRLQQSEERYLLASNATSDAIWDLDVATRWIHWGRGVEALFGWTDAATHGTPLEWWEDRVHPDDRSRVKAELEKAIAQGDDRWQAEYRFQRADGSFADVLDRSFALRDLKSEAPIRLVGSMLDLTERRQTERELHRMQRRAREILESVTDAFYAVDGDWRITYMNSQAEPFLGAPFSELSNQILWDAFPDLVGTVIESQLRRAAQENNPIHFTDYYEPLETWFEIKVYPFDNGLSVYFCDVTDRMSRDRALRRSEAHLRQITDSMPQLVWTATPDGYHDYFNANWYEYTGMPRPNEHGGHDQGWNWKEYLHPDDYQRSVEQWQHCLETGEPYYIEYRFKRARDGAYRWFIGRAYPLVDPDGGIARWFGTCTDIHDLRETEEALRRSEERLRLATAAASVAVFEVDAGGRIAIVSHQAATGIPEPKREVIGPMPWPDLIQRVHPDDRPGLLRVVRGDDQISDSVEVAFRVRADDGAYRWMAARGNVIPESDGRHRVLGVLLDITDQKRYEAELIAAREEALAAARVKSALLTNMSHELRTPLTSILGFAELLQHELPPAHQEMIWHISENGERLHDTLESVLELAHLEAFDRLLECEALPLNPIVAEVVDRFASRAAQKGLTLQCDLPPQPLMSRTDIRAVRRIAVSLVSNAVKFTRTGSIHVSLTRDGEMALLAVRDTGIGMSEDFLPHLFSEFRQESEGIERRFEGAGIGLAITRRLVEMMGGTITVASVPHAGSTFQVRLPLASVA